MNAAERQRPAAGELFLDHIAHFVPDLEAAAALLARLGFVCTPRSDHRTQHGRAGTANRCVMLENGYLEILAATLDTPEARDVRAHMRRYAGVHLACFGTPAAEEEHLRLAAHGFAPRPMVHLERSVEGGKRVRFSVVRLPPGKMAEGRIQYVQQLTPEIIWLPRHLRHSNGVTGLSALFVVAKDPAMVAARWGRFAGLLPFRASGLVAMLPTRGKIFFAKKKTLQGLLGRSPSAPALAGYALACRNPERMASLCKREGLSVHPRGKLYSVELPPALGGAWLLGTERQLAALGAGHHR